MTIREIERAAGMTRANIRFYEKEGLLEPRRERNGYRDYSERDLETLGKIKLLRQLHLDLETIRGLQRGNLELSAALRERLEALEGEAADLERAREICRAMEADRVSYANLEPEKYLERVPQAERGYFAPPADGLPTVGHPFRRFFARWLDLCLYGVLWSALHMLVFRFQTPAGLPGTLLDSYAGILFMFLLEPLMLSTWGSTPGKFIFGLVVRDGDGRKLSWSVAMTRTGRIFAKGYGYGIPFYNIYRGYKSLRACDAGEVLPWEEDCSYTIRDVKGLRTAGFLGAVAAVLLLGAVVSLQAEMPRNRGELTAAEFAENVNDLGSYTGRLDSYTRLDESGRWVETAPAGVYVIAITNIKTPDLQLTVEGGEVTAVRMEMELTGEQIITTSFQNIKILSAFSLIGAQPRVNCLNLRTDDLVDALNDSFGNYRVEKGGVTMSQTVEYRGYSGGDAFLFAEEGSGERYFHLIFTLEKQA